MNIKGISEIIKNLTGEVVLTTVGTENIYISCPLAKHNHKNGVDKSKGFSIKVNSLGSSPCCCWNTGCGFRGNIKQLIKTYCELEEMSPRELLSLYRKYSLIEFDDILSDLDDTVITYTQDYFPDSYLLNYPKVRKPWRGCSLETLDAWDVRIDFDKQRVLFPVRNKDRKLVGAIGRTYSGHKIKYSNYWNFRKGHFLFGEGVDLQEKVIIIEGQVDALRVHQALKGEYSVASLMGSSPSAQQLNKLKTYYKSAVIFMDQDVAGYQGAIKLTKNLINHLPLKIVIKPFKGSDPGSLNDSQIRKLVSNAIPIESGYI